MSLLLELHEPPVPDTYMNLFPHLLAPVLWERPGNIPALVRLLQAIIAKVTFQQFFCSECPFSSVVCYSIVCNLREQFSFAFHNEC